MPQQVRPDNCSHLVFGGELTDLGGIEFKDLDKLDIVGIYPNYATAYAAWKAKAQQTVDNAHMRYFIVHLHRLLEPETDTAALNAVNALLKRSGALAPPFRDGRSSWRPSTFV